MDAFTENGSGFPVYLPGPGQAINTQTEIRTTPLPSRERILYVEDEPEVSKLVQKLLEHLGYQVTALTSSLKAREVFRRGPEEFDLVITDMAMPWMTGLELAADFTNIRPDLPIILCSRFMEPAIQEIAGKLGVRECLSKPATIADFARAIRRVLNSGKG